MLCQESLNHLMSALRRHRDKVTLEAFCELWEGNRYEEYENEVRKDRERRGLVQGAMEETIGRRVQAEREQ